MIFSFLLCSYFEIFFLRIHFCCIISYFDILFLRIHLCCILLLFWYFIFAYTPLLHFAQSVSKKLFFNLFCVHLFVCFKLFNFSKFYTYINKERDREREIVIYFEDNRKLKHLKVKFFIYVSWFNALFCYHLLQYKY